MTGAKNSWREYPAWENIDFDLAEIGRMSQDRSDLVARITGKWSINQGVIACGGIVDKVLVDCQLCREALKKCVRKSKPRAVKLEYSFRWFNEGEEKFNGAPVSSNEKEEGGESEGSYGSLCHSFVVFETKTKVKFIH